MDIDKIWIKILENEGKSIQLDNGDAFIYRVAGDNIYIDSNNWRVSKSSLETAIKFRHKYSKNKSSSDQVSYIYAILNNL